MTRTQVSAIALAFSALFAGQAMAANTETTATRAQVNAERADAIRTGNVVVGESSAKLNEVFPHNYSAQRNVAGKTRDEVRAELAEATRTGNVIVGESSVKLNEAYPHSYPAQQNVASKSRDEVRTELAEAAASGKLFRQIEA